MAQDFRMSVQDSSECPCTLRAVQLGPQFLNYVVDLIRRQAHVGTVVATNYVDEKLRLLVGEERRLARLVTELCLAGSVIVERGFRDRRRYARAGLFSRHVSCLQV
jgi:hypothetical protein